MFAVARFHDAQAGLRASDRVISAKGVSVSELMQQTAPTRREWCSRVARHRILLMNLTISSIGSVVGMLPPRTFGVTVGRSFL
jgi:hypothetical protein